MKENISELSGNSTSLTKSTVKCPKALSVSHISCMYTHKELYF